MDTPSPFLVVPPTRDGRWRLIEEVIAQWFPADAGRKIPTGNSPRSPPEISCTALREWFAFVERRPGIWCRQDGLFDGHYYDRDQEFLIIGVENQACALWGVRRADLVLDDPPVHFDAVANGHWELENSTTSEFAVTWLAGSIKFSDHNRCWASGSASQAALQRVTGRYPRLGLADWHWPAYPTRFYGTADLLLEVDGDADNLWFWPAARTEAAFRELLALVDREVQWQSSSDEWPAGWVSASRDPN